MKGKQATQPKARTSGTRLLRHHCRRCYYSTQSDEKVKMLDSWPVSSFPDIYSYILNTGKAFLRQSGQVLLLSTCMYMCVILDHLQATRQPTTSSEVCWNCASTSLNPHIESTFNFVVCYFQCYVFTAYNSFFQSHAITCKVTGQAHCIE